MTIILAILIIWAAYTVGHWVGWGRGWKEGYNSLSAYDGGDDLDPPPVHRRME